MTQQNGNHLNKSFQKIKGKIGEHLIKELFENLGYDVEFTGVEYRTPAYANLVKRNKDFKIFKTMSYFPDFYMYSKEKNKPFLVEVKFRQNGKLLVNEIFQYHEDETIIIVISPDSFACNRIGDLKNKFQSSKDKKDCYIEPENFVPLQDFKEFGFNKEEKNTISDYIKMANVFFEGLNGLYPKLKKE